MKLLTYKTQDTEPRLGFLHNNQVVDMEDFGEISNFPLPNDMLDLIDMGFEIEFHHAVGKLFVGFNGKLNSQPCLSPILLLMI